MASTSLPDNDCFLPGGVAFDDVVARYYAPVFRYLLRQTGDRELAADLAQETFLDAYRDLHRLPVDRPLSAWLFRIAFNNLRSVRRRSAMSLQVSLDALVLASGPVLPAPVQTDGDLSAVDERDLVVHALRSLTPGLRVALLLHVGSGLTAGDVARSLGISGAAAERRISRAKQQLRLHYALLTEES